MVCPHCGEEQYSMVDKAYLFNFKTCWSCDKKRFDSGELSKKEFEAREEACYQS